MKFKCECQMFACTQRPFESRLRITKDYDQNVIDTEFIPEPIEQCEIRQRQLYNISKLAIKLSTLKEQYGVEE